MHDCIQGACLHAPINEEAEQDGLNLLSKLIYCITFMVNITICDISYSEYFTVFANIFYLQAH